MKHQAGYDRELEYIKSLLCHGCLGEFADCVTRSLTRRTHLSSNLISNTLNSRLILRYNRAYELGGLNGAIRSSIDRYKNALMRDLGISIDVCLGYQNAAPHLTHVLWKLRGAIPGQIETFMPIKL